MEGGPRCSLPRRSSRPARRLLAFAAMRKLSHREEVVLAYAAAGVAEERLDRLAMILFAAAAGLDRSVYSGRRSGSRPRSGWSCYFAVAVGF